MRRSGKPKLPPHVLAAVEEKARARRADERAFFWSEVEAARTGVGGARSHGRCLPDTEEELFPHLFHRGDDDDDDDAMDDDARAAQRRAALAEAYDDIPVTVDDPLAAAGVAEAVAPLPEGPAGVDALASSLADDRLRENVRRRLGFTALTPIQRYAVPLAWAGRDLICSAATGSGKTAAYLIPAIQGILAEPEGAAAEGAEGAEGADADDANVEVEPDASALEPLWEVPKTTAASSARGGYGRRRAGGVVSVDAALEADLDDLFSDADAEDEDEDEDEDEFDGSSSSSSSSSSVSDPHAGLVTPASPRVVILVPTRELAAQVALQARRLVFSTGLRVALLHGGQSVKPQLEQLAHAPHVVVSTPGRLLTCAKDEPYLDLTRVRTLVLDEADQMVDMGFEPQVAEILRDAGVPPPASGLPRGARSRDGRQTLMFSATFPPNVRRLAASLVVGGSAPPPANVAVGRVGSTVAGIEQRFVPADALRERKFNLLEAVLRATPDSDRTLVFCAGKSTAAWVRAQLQRVLEEETAKERAAAAVAGAETETETETTLSPAATMFAAEELHGDCTQGARSRALDAFASGACRVLVATDVASRGLDLPDVRHVINFDLPTDARDFDAYVHRIGRTGRAGRRGLATSLYVPGFGGDGNGPIHRALSELMEETGQRPPAWFEALPDRAGAPPGGFARGGGGGGGRGRGGGRGTFPTRGPPMGRRY